VTRLQVSPREFFRYLRANKYELDRINGSHHIFYHSESGKSLTVPVHSGSDLKKGMLIDLLVKMGKSADDFIKWRNS
jgi:predicted RNA binding protein YcfA (HicA-like mRNA interferase family)